MILLGVNIARGLRPLANTELEAAVARWEANFVKILNCNWFVKRVAEEEL